MTTEDICPVCESKITAGSQACDVCGADLKLLSDSSKAQYICPECGSEIGEQDTKCPSCGVQFAVEEDVLFQCPACNSEVSSTATKCPNCGVEFLTEEEASAAEEVPKSIDSVPSVKLPEAETFDDIAEGISTGAPESLINEFEKTLSGIEVQVEPEAAEEPEEALEADLPEEAEIQENDKMPEPAVHAEQPRAESPAGPSVREAAKDDKKGLFHFKWGKKKEDKPKEKPSSKVEHHRNIVSATTAQAAATATVSDITEPHPAPRVTVSVMDNDETKPIIEDLRHLLKFAGESRIDISDGKKYLDMSVEFAKGGDGTESLRQIRLAHKSIEGNIQSFFKDKMEIMRKQIEIENVTGERKQTYERRLAEISELARSKSYERAFQSVQQFQSDLSPKASQFGEAKELIDNLEELLRYADEIGIDYNSSRMIFTEARKHLAIGDWSSALVLAKQSKDSLMRSIPTKLLSEMNRAKSEIIDAKIGGLRVTDFIATLKEASNAYNDGKYDESLRYMNIFRREFDRARSLSSGPRAL